MQDKLMKILDAIVDWPTLNKAEEIVFNGTEKGILQECKDAFKSNLKGE